MSKGKKTVLGFSIVFTVLFLVIGAVEIIKEIQLDRNCVGYLKRAGDANTVELAKSQMKLAVDYLERTGTTDGYTSVLWRTPDEDVGYWYKNLKTADEELATVDESSTKLEKSNMLMKLRETLLDQGAKGTKITVPQGLYLFPYNVMYAILIWSTLILAVGFWILWFSLY